MFKILYQQIKGILLTPGKTLGLLMDKRKWLPIFLLIMLLMSVFTYLTLPAQMAQKAELLKNSEISERLSDQEIDSLTNYSGIKRFTGVLWSLLLLSISLAVGAFFTYLFYGIGRVEGLYANYFSLVVNASIIDIILPLILGALSLLLSLNLMNLVKLSAFFPKTAEANFFSLLTAQIDLFSVWYMVAIAAGISQFSKISFSKSIRIGAFYFLFKVMVKVIFSYLSIKIMGL